MYISIFVVNIVVTLNDAWYHLAELNKNTVYSIYNYWGILCCEKDLKWQETKDLSRLVQMFPFSFHMIQCFLAETLQTSP